MGMIGGFISGGAGTGKAKIDAQENIILGEGTMISVQADDTHNIAIGNEVLAGDTESLTQTKNIFIGNEAGILGRIYSNSISIGWKSSTSSVGAAGQTAVGNESCRYHETGNWNAAFGYRSLFYLADGARNTAIGSNSLFTSDPANVNNGDNTAIGYRAGYYVSTGIKNTFVGADAGYGADGQELTGTNNVGIGFEALKVVQVGASLNVCVGSGAGVLVTTGNNNMCMGGGAGNLTTTGSNNTFIGYQAAAPVATEDWNLRFGYYGMVKYKCVLVTCTAADGGDLSIIAEVCKIPRYSIIKRVSAEIHGASNLGAPYKGCLALSTATGTAADGALVNASTTITVPEILGAGAANTYQRNSTTAMAGTAADINMSNAIAHFTAWYNEPTTTIVGTADTYLYVCNAGTGNGTTSAGTPCKLRIVVEYTGGA